MKQEEDKSEISGSQPIEDLGPDDLERIERTQTEDVDDDEWSDPEAERRQEEQKQWLEGLSDPDDPSQRVVELGPHFAALFEGYSLTLHGFEEQKSMAIGFDHWRYSDDELRKKLKVYAPFS